MKLIAPTGKAPGPLGSWCPRPDLNRDQRFRKPLLYPVELREHWAQAFARFSRCQSGLEVVRYGPSGSLSNLSLIALVPYRPQNLGGGRYNLWNVNSDAEYHEESRDSGGNPVRTERA